ncbi:MAG TPA: hypothetical protein VGL89_08610 [Candidatus Koribacter sp.]|jgi:hypothetical protein
MQIEGVFKQLLNQHPLLIVFDILAVVTAIGCVLVLVREAILFRGYRSLKSGAKGIAKELGGTIFRDGADLVVNGFYRGIPAVLRFSFAEHTPEVVLWMKMASALNLYVTHKSAKSTEGRTRVPTRDAWFDDRFVIRTDNPNDAMALLTDDRAFGELKKLCCSPHTVVALSKGSLEMSEQSLPQPDPFKHLLNHMGSLAEIAVRVGAISNLPKSKNKIYVPDRYIVARVALVLLVIGGGVEVVSAVRHYGSEGTAATSDPVASTTTLSQSELLNLPSSNDWRLATANDFDSSTVEWLDRSGKHVSARFSVNAEGREVVGVGYALVSKDPSQQDTWRVALISQGRDIFDGKFKNILAVIPLKQESLQGIAWAAPPGSTQSDGDGFMIIRRDGDTNVAQIYYLSAGKLVSGVPTNYTEMDLQ